MYSVHDTVTFAPPTGFPVSTSITVPINTVDESAEEVGHMVLMSVVAEGTPKTIPIPSSSGTFVSFVPIARLSESR
jgi:hypothetical protein